MKTLKNFVLVVLAIMAAYIVWESIALPTEFEVVYSEPYYTGQVTHKVTYQAKNCFGHNLGEEYTVDELTPEYMPMVIEFYRQVYGN